MTSNVSTAHSRLWVVVPAAGAGRRIPGKEPKQYARLAGQTVLEWSLQPFLRRNDLAGIVVAISAGDEHWLQLQLQANPKIRTAAGGAQRVHSVQNALEVLRSVAHADDWVLVHDAARPCLTDADLELLIAALLNDAVGGLLATPLIDTVKESAGDDRVARTVSRDRLWRALTPQMFRYGVLTQALAQAAAAGRTVTDEASAIEMSGRKPRLVAGRPDNIKITLPDDLQLAESILKGRA